MSIAALLNPADPAFAFDHDRLHREMFYATKGGTGAVQYLLDPFSDINVEAGWWNTYHAQAHNDFASAHATIYWPSTVAISDLVQNQGAKEWWAFSNRHAHDLARQALASG